MTETLIGKVALVTGSGRNIGRAIALRLAFAGADVVINSRSNLEEAQEVAATARTMGVRALASLADVSDPQQVEQMVEEAVAEFGRIDILVNNAAVRPSKPFVDLTLEDWASVRGVVLDGAFYCTKAVVPSMVEHGYGRIVFLVGDGAFIGASPRAHVSAAKMGLVGMARSLAKELGRDGIRVNLVSPGIIDTSRVDGLFPPGYGQAANGPLERSGTVDEIAAACAFLVSEESSFMTGQTLHVNGGSGVLG